MQPWRREKGRFLTILLALGGGSARARRCAPPAATKSARRLFGGCRHDAAGRLRPPTIAFVGAPPRSIAAPAFSSSAATARGIATAEEPALRGPASERGHPPRRRRRGALRASQRTRLLGTAEPALPGVAAATTRYTIDDAVCPPTDPDALRRLVRKHIRTLPRYWTSKPVAEHTARAFEEALDFAGRRGASAGGARAKIILDSGCGTGKSSFLLGEKYPDCVVLGIDRSLARLSRNAAYDPHRPGNQRPPHGKHGNVLLLRAELTDFWKCCLASSRWQRFRVQRHYLLYPNPYPKKSRLKRRFYAGPEFPLLMLTLTPDAHDGSAGAGERGAEERGTLVLRSNWKGYLDEFKLAVDVWEEAGGSAEEFRARLGEVDAGDEWRPGTAAGRWEARGPGPLGVDGGGLTNFEVKYLECGEPVYELSVFNTEREAE